jgi:predicted amidohydrolase YtcJ
MLDAATGQVPTALISHDLHCVWLNSAAAARYGMQVDASGLLREDAAFALTRELGHLPDAVVDSWVRDAARDAAASTRGHGRIRAGNAADTAVLDGDPLAVPDAVFARMPVAATLVAGKFSHRGPSI